MVGSHNQSSEIIKREALSKKMVQYKRGCPVFRFPSRILTVWSLAGCWVRRRDGTRSCSHAFHVFLDKLCHDWCLYTPGQPTVQLSPAELVLTLITPVFWWGWGGYFCIPAVCWGSGGRRWQGWCRPRRLQQDDRPGTRSSSYLATRNDHIIPHYSVFLSPDFSWRSTTSSLRILQILNGNQLKGNIIIPSYNEEKVTSGRKT